MYKDHEFQRKTFQKTILDLINLDLKEAPFNILDAAEKVRDSTFHGRRPSDETLRTAISNALKYVDSFGEAIREKVEKNPFGDLRGLTSRLKMLSKEQARWIIKGVKMSSEAK